MRHNFVSYTGITALIEGEPWKEPTLHISYGGGIVRVPLLPAFAEWLKRQLNHEAFPERRKGDRRRA